MPSPHATKRRKLQMRLTTPLPGRIRRASPHADVLVALSSGLAGKREEHKVVAHHLGLHRWGDQALLRGRDRDRMGLAYEIKHLVTITHLDYEVSTLDILPTSSQESAGLRRIPGTDYRLRGPDTAGRHDSTEWVGVVRHLELIPESGLEGGFYEYENDEYIQIEVADDGGSVVWSSDLPARDLAERLASLLGAPDPRCYGLTVDESGKSFEDESLAVLKRAQQPAYRLRSFLVGYPDAVVSWRRAQVKMSGGTVPHVEVAMSCARFNISQLLQLIDETGTPAVKANLARNNAPLIQSLGDIASD